MAVATVINIDDLFVPKTFGVIVKTKPKDFIYVFNNDEEILMKFFNKKFDHRIDYNGQIFYLSEKQHKDLTELGYDDLSLLGITHRTKSDTKYSDDKALELAKRFNNKIESDSKIFLVTTNKDKETITKIAETISRYWNNPVEKIYLYENYNDSEIIVYDKENLVLSLLLGKEIESNTITKTDISAYTSVDCIGFDEVDLYDIYQNLIGIDTDKIDGYIKQIKYVNRIFVIT